MVSAAGRTNAVVVGSVLESKWRAVRGTSSANGQLRLQVATLNYTNLKPRVVVRTCGPSAWLGEARTLGVPNRPPAM